MDMNNDIHNDMHNYILPQVPILRKKWSKLDKLVLPIILDNNNELEKFNNINNIDNIDDIDCIHKSDYNHNASTISKWRVKTHKRVTIQYIKRSQKIVNKHK
uniref:Uncharacterized protein n=1 Tax=viral metagenome TaxID=1070528 RepID=A0A6C0HM61_9ZZZZ